MAGKITSLPKVRPEKLLHGTYPPSPSLGKTSPPSVKPQPASTRSYGKIPPPLDGNTGMTGLT